MGSLDGSERGRYAVGALVLPVVAVQIGPAESAPALERQLLEACSAGLERARCVSARGIGQAAPRGIAIVSWDSPAHATIQVGLGAEEGAAPLWVSRELSFASGDPAHERWRAVGFTIALLADDPRFWPSAPVGPRALTPAPVNAPAPVDTGTSEPQPVDVRAPIVAEARGLAAPGLLSGPWRWGAELRFAAPLGRTFFVTAGVSHSLANDESIDLRWLDLSAGVGARVDLFSGVEGRVRLELLAENIAATVQRGELSDHAAVWLPGVSLGGDLHVPLGDAWLLSTRADLFLLDGSTPIISAGERLGAAAGGGVMLGLGAGYRL